MTCAPVQQWLLQSAASDAPPGDVAAHLSTCADCRRYAARLRALEQAVLSLPLPAGAGPARDAFLSRLAGTTRLPQRRILRPVLALAATLLIAVTAGLWLLGDRPAEDDPAFVEASTSVIDSTLDLNLRLASLDTIEEREKTYIEHRPKLASRVRSARLSPDDRTLAERLLDNATLLSKTVDPFDDAERFTEAEDLVVRRVTDAAARKDAQRLKRLSKLYEKLVENGVNEKLERAAEKSTKSEDDRRLKRMERRNQESRRALAAAADSAPETARPDLRRAVELSKKPRKNKPTTRPTHSAS